MRPGTDIARSFGAAPKRDRSGALRGRVIGLLAVIVGSLCATGAGAQGERPPERPAPPEVAPARELTPERMKQRIRQRLEATRGEMETLRTREVNLIEALARLEDGASVREVLDVLREDEPLRGMGPQGGPILQPPRHEGGERPEAGEPRERLAPGRPAALTPEERRQVLGMIARDFPELYQRLQAAETASPNEMDRLVMRVAPRVRELQELRERDPAMARIRLSEFRASLDFVFLSRDWREAFEQGDVGRQAELRRRVRANLAEMFDARSRAQQLELDRLKERMAQLERELEERRVNRDRLLDEQLERMEPNPPARGRGQDRPPPRGG
ncbi:MAG: hypothetical protein KF866_04270 [Phycisphaeraceae bacterium]|nr:hypothetical protein [Phycisphaeraceae bacterium]